MRIARKSSIPTDTEDELTEITKMSAPRIDLVHGPANGIGFLLAKSTGDPSMFNEDEIAALAKRSEEGDSMTDTAAAPADDITLEKADDDTSDAMTDTDAPADAMTDTDAPADAMTDTDAPADAMLDPDSAAWEQLDASRAEQAIELVVALQRLVSTAAEREAQEALTGDDADDADNAYSLQMVLDELDCILGVLAPFAVSEAAEAQDREDDDELVLKSGRVLSGMNEDRIRQASDLLGQVLGSLPAADPDLAKSEAADDLEKADDTTSKLVLVYGPSGSAKPPLGAVNLDAITEFAPTPEDEDGDGTVDEQEAADTTDTPADDTPSDADQPTPDEMEDARTIPGTDTVQAPADTPADDEENVTKGALTPELEKALEERLAPLAKALEKSAAENQELKKRLDEFGKRPDDRNSPARNGAMPREAQRGDVQENHLLTKAQEATTPAERIAVISDEIMRRFTR